MWYLVKCFLKVQIDKIYRSSSTSRQTWKTPESLLPLQDHPQLAGRRGRLQHLHLPLQDHPQLAGRCGRLQHLHLPLQDHPQLAGRRGRPCNRLPHPRSTRIADPRM